MTTFLYCIMAVVPVTALLFSAFYTYKKHLDGQPVKKSMRVNVATFLVMILLVAACSASVSALESDAATPPAQTAQGDAQAVQEQEAQQSGSSKGLGLLAAGLVTGLAGIGGGIAVAAGAPAAIAATSEDPKAFGKSLIFVALGESIALYGVVISILILNKV